MPEAMHANTSRVQPKVAGWCLWCLAGLLTLAVVLLGWVSAAAGSDPQPARVAEALRTVYDGDRVIDRSLVSLPDRLKPEWNGERLRLVYDITVAIDPADDTSVPQALWLLRAGAPYRLAIDGTPHLPMLPLGDSQPQRVGAGSSPQLNGRSPALFRLPAGTQTVQLTLHAPPFMPYGLVEVRHGAAQAMIRHHLEHYETLALPVQISQVMALSVGLLALLLWALRRHEWPLLFFAFMALSLGLRETFYQASVLPISGRWFELSNPWFITHFVTAALALTLSLTGGMNLRRRRLLLGVWGLLQLLFAWVAMSTAGLHAIRLLVVLLGNLALLGIIWLLLQHPGRLSRGRAWILLSGFLVMLIGSVHDLGMAMGWSPPDQGTWIAWGFSGLVAAYGIVTADHVLRQLDQAKITRTLLAERLQAFTQALTQSLAAEARTEQDKARHQERQQVMRDLHDTLGARLITALRGVERQALDKASLVDLLRESVSDLSRLRGQAGAPSPIGPALQQWHDAWSTHLNQAGMPLTWTLVPEIDRLEASAHTLEVLRSFLQEATANALKHARASRMHISCSVDTGDLVLTVEDDGIGLDSEAPSDQAGNGMGLPGMRARASALGARLETGSSPLLGGARLTLIIPLARLRSAGQTQS